MKKIFLLMLAMVMSFTLVACGANNDENNAAMQAKMDETTTLAQEINNWYKDNGYLEGDSAAEYQTAVDTLTAQMDDLKAAHQEILDAGGYSDEDTATMAQTLDTAIKGFKEAKEQLEGAKELVKDATAIGVLAEKYSELVDMVNKASTIATENGWENDEEWSSELNAAYKVLEVVGGDLQNPDTMDEEYMNTVSTSLDEMIPVWQDYLKQVSEPYIGN